MKEKTKDKIKKAVVTAGAGLTTAVANAQMPEVPTLTGSATNAQSLLDATNTVGNYGIGAVIVVAVISVVLAVGALVRKALRGRSTSV